MKINLKNDFIEKANAVYDSKFNYSLVRYNGATKKVQIACPKHGVFEQSPTVHLRGSDCPYCKKGSQTREQFIQQMNELYQNGHEYTKCEYNLYFKNSDYLTVTCKKHGDFYVRVRDYMKGKGCPKCNQSFKAEDKYVLSVVYKTADNSLSIQGDQFSTKSAAMKHLGELKDAIELTGATIQSAEVAKMETSSIVKNRTETSFSIAKRFASAITLIISFLKF